MYLEKEIQSELHKLTKVFKEKQENLLAACARKEKKIADEYQAHTEALARKHHKQQETLQKQIANEKKALRRRLDHEMQVELRLHRRYAALRSQSTGRVNIGRESEHSSVYSLDDNTLRAVEPDTIHSNMDIANKAVLRQRPRWMARKAKKQGIQIQHEMESHPDLAKPFRRLKKEMEERLKYANEDAKMAMADFQWQCLKERHDLKRDYLEALADFKQNRLTSLGQLKQSRIKSYFDIRRKWLMVQHTREMESRNRTQQDALKRLSMAQAVERQTACRLARTTAKGQRKVSSVLNSVSSHENAWDRENLKSSSSQHNSVSNRPTSANTTLINMIFPKTGQSTPDDLSVNHNKPLAGSVRPYSSYDVIRPTMSTVDGDDIETKTVQSSRTLTQQDHEHGQALSSLSAVSSKRLGLRSHQERLNSKSELRQAKSVQSIQSALDTCDQVQRIVISTLSKQQVDQWTEVLNQERALTDALLEAHTEQKKSLLQEETAALKRAQAEQEYRAADLASFLEATEKFAEREFIEERNRLLTYYYGSADAIPASSAARLDPTESELVRDFNSLHTTDERNHSLNPNTERTLSVYPPLRDREDKCILVNEDTQAMIASCASPPKEHVIICREDRNDIVSSY